ncbi:hypothetical protein [Aeromonas sp. FDAARGOS 1404]|uniref:hypothetical protein n=1 Tax=Aeromonas TaxID=642 RepID=UPI001C212B58|nr:hypothetical protein [Aeromonas sp. FDAARGOS 1404]QWZ85770.1 hypothetical protein I6L34_02375 [Aeromonas sp. FDAARGOS 1404]
MSLSDDINDFSHAPMRGDIEVDSYNLPEYSVGMNDNGEALYSFNGLEMTEAQRDSLFGVSEETCTIEQEHNLDTYVESTENDESNQHPIYSKLDTINKASGDVGQFYSDALFNNDHEAMASVSNATGMEQDEINSYAYAVLADISNELGADYNQMVEMLEQDISHIKSTRSEAGYKVLDSAIKKAFKGDYQGAMSLWDGYRKIIYKNK